MNGPAEVLLQLIVARPHTRPLIDLLLAHGDGLFFTASRIRGHGQPDEQLSLQEQVAGAQNKVRIEVELPAQGVDSLLADIDAQFSRGSVFFRVLPILRQGCVGGGAFYSQPSQPDLD